MTEEVKKAQPQKSQKKKPTKIEDAAKAQKKPEPTLYEKLSKPIPEEFLVSYTDNGKEFTGYHAQYSIDLLNETVGVGGWYTMELIQKEELINGAWAVAMSVILSIKHEKENIKVTGYGGSYAKDIANAYKGAKTSAFKNACRYLGIGKELYIKGFEDDIVVETTPNTVEEKESQTMADDKVNDLFGRIQSCKTQEELEALYPEIEKVTGESTKKLLTKKFNDKKLSL